MAPLPLTVAKNKRTGFLPRVRRKIVNLKAICDDPEVLELDKLSTALERLVEAWRKYENSQQDVLGLVAEDKFVNEQFTFTEMEEIYEAVNKESAADETPAEETVPDKEAAPAEEAATAAEEVIVEEAAADDAPAKKESAAEVIDEAEGEATDELLRDTAAQEDATGHDLRELAKEAGLEEMYKIEGEAPDELLRDTAAQEDVTADDVTGPDLRELAKYAGLEDVTSDDAAGYDLRVLATEADINPKAAARIKQDNSIGGGDEDNVVELLDGGVMGLHLSILV